MMVGVNYSAKCYSYAPIGDEPCKIFFLRQGKTNDVEKELKRFHTSCQGFGSPALS